MKRCSFCKSSLKIKVIDLGKTAIANNYLNNSKEIKFEKKYPLEIFFCSSCYLVQTGIRLPAGKIFKENYAYLSSTSSSWLKHCYNYFLKIKKILSLNKNSSVLEIASNDGYLLQYFKKIGMNCIGIEPTSSAAKIAIRKGINTEIDFFSFKFAKKISRKFNRLDLVIGNNVLAHVPDINDFVKGLAYIIKKFNSIATFEVQYLKNIVSKCQFDTLYHEHYYYYSVSSLKNIFNYYDLKIYNVEEVPTHGGSIRIYVKSKNNEYFKNNKKVDQFLKNEKKIKLNSKLYFKQFNKKLKNFKNNFKKFLIKNKNMDILAYGAAAKTNTCFNYLKINSNDIKLIFDESKLKQNKLLPGSHIKIINPKNIRNHKFDILLIMIWNIEKEIKKKYSFLKNKNVKMISINKFK